MYCEDMNMIEIKGLKKSYGDLSVLDGIDLTIEDGEIYGLVGTSGAGKSTLLNCINGLELYDSGSVEVDGVRVESLGEEGLRSLRKNMGMIFQGFSLISRKNVYQNIAIPMECWGFGKSEIKRKVNELAELVGLKDKLKSRPDELSGGQKQRVAIARALTMNPEYLLCDECTSALDPKTTMSILNLLESIRKEMGITIVVVTHEMAVIKQLCDRMSILENGRVSESGKVSDIFLNKSDSFKRLLGEEQELLPEHGVNLMFNLTSDMVDDPVLWGLSKNIKGKYSLVNSESNYFQSKKYLSITVNIGESDRAAAESYLKSRGIEYKVSGKEGIYVR